MFRIQQTAEFADWFERLRDQRARSSIAVRIARIESGNFGDCKSVGGSVREIRVDVGPGYRIYFMMRGRELIILLCGGDKGSQRRDIDRAKALAKKH